MSEDIGKLPERVASSAEWDSACRPAQNPPSQAVRDYLRTIRAVMEAEIRKLLHDPSEVLSRVVQPVLWLLLFGEVFSRVRGIPTHGMRYLDFMAAGILAQSVLFIAIFYGISIIFERDMGVLVKYLVSPAPRTALVLGKALSAGVRALTQGIIVGILCLLLGVHLNGDPLALVGVLALVVLGSALFSTFSMIIACLVKTQQRFMGIGQLMTMPLFFASNAIYPIAMMPPWLQVIARINPLTYEVDGIRALMLAHSTSVYGVGLDFGVLIAMTALLVMIGGKLYANIAI